MDASALQAQPIWFFKHDTIINHTWYKMTTCRKWSSVITKPHKHILQARYPSPSHLGPKLLPSAALPSKEGMFVRILLTEHPAQSPTTKRLWYLTYTDLHAQNSFLLQRFQIRDEYCVQLKVMDVPRQLINGLYSMVNKLFYFYLY